MIGAVQGMIEGFRFTIDARENNQFLPLNRRMFFRHSMVECMPSHIGISPASAGPAAAAAASRQQQQQQHQLVAAVGSSSSNNNNNSAPCATSLQEDRMILQLLLRQNEVKDQLVGIMQELHKNSQGCKDADFDCMPMNMDVLDAVGASAQLQGGMSSASSSLAASFHARRTADCKRWNPDMPELLGLYHAYVRGYNKDTRCALLFYLACLLRAAGAAGPLMLPPHCCCHNTRQDPQALHHHEWRVQQPQ